MVISTAITGDEIVADPGSQVAALVEFYRGFNHRDLDRVANVWAPIEDIAMDNPLGGIRRGWNEIRAVYQRLFDGPARVYVEFYDYSLIGTDAMFCAVGRERGELVLGDTRVPLAIRTSRVYQRLDGRWRQVHHHGSIDDPVLLARYQAVITTCQGAPRFHNM
jgi:ketosteroid isomerase-like protein